MTVTSSAALLVGSVCDDQTDPVRILPDGRMSRENAAKYLGLSAKTLAMWKLSGRGPPWVKVGGRVFYFREDLDVFIRRDAALIASP